MWECLTGWWLLPGGRVIFVGGEGGGRAAGARCSASSGSGLRRLGADACEVKSETGVARFLEECCNRLEGGDAQ